MPFVTVRMASPADAAALLAIYRPYVETTAITFEYEVPTEEEFAARIAKTLQRYPYLVAEENGTVVGYAYAGALKERRAYDWSVETSIYVAKAAHGKGVGRTLYKALETILQRQGICNVNACIAAPIEEDETLTCDSIRFHERMGYAMVGEFHRCGSKFGRWYNMVWMEKMIGEHLPDPAPIRPLPEILNEIDL